MGFGLHIGMKFGVKVVQTGSGVWVVTCQFSGWKHNRTQPCVPVAQSC